MTVPSRFARVTSDNKYLFINTELALDRNASELTTCFIKKKMHAGEV